MRLLGQVLLGIVITFVLAFLLFALLAPSARAAPLIHCDDRGCRTVQTSHRARKPREARGRASRRPYVRERGRAKIARVSRAGRLSGRPAGCPARAWCGCFLALHVFRRNVRSLWLARAWAGVGRAAHGPAPGVIAVYRHHVGIVRRVVGPGRIVMLSGNDSRAVRERERSTRGIIAWRRL